MKRPLRIGIIQQSNTPDPNENRGRLLEKIAKLASKGVRLIVLQELHDSLYFCQTEDTGNFDLAVPGEQSGAARLYSEAARQYGVVIVTSLFERRAAGLYHNTAYVFDADGSLAGKYRKMHNTCICTCHSALKSCRKHCLLLNQIHSRQCRKICQCFFSHLRYDAFHKSIFFFPCFKIRITLFSQMPFVIVIDGTDNKFIL